MTRTIHTSGKNVMRGAALFFALWLAWSFSAFAGILIAMDDDEFRQEYLFQGPRVNLSMPEGERFLIFCESNTFALISSDDSAYWYGTPQQYREEIDELLMMFAQGDEDFFADREPVFLTDLIDNPAIPSVKVRTTRLGAETIAGYEAREYVVEYENNGTWREHERLWIAPALLQEINTETGGPCMTTVVMDVLRSNLGMMIFDMMDEFGVMWSIITSPAYLNLLEEGFVMRDKSVIEMYGMTIETTTEVTEVNHVALDETLFDIPEGARQITLLEAAM